MANLVSIPIYRINQSPIWQSGEAVKYWALGSTSIVAQPVAAPNNNVNGAIIYSAIKTPATGDAVLYSTMTVAAIITAAG